MLCRYWGVPTTYAQLTATLKSNPDFGTPFPNLTRLQRHGLRVQISTGTLKALYKLLQSSQPIVVPVQTVELPYWRGEKSQHAVVVVGMTPTQTLLHDPILNSGPVGVALGDFDLAWLAMDEEFALITPAD